MYNSFLSFVFAKILCPYALFFVIIHHFLHQKMPIPIQESFICSVQNASLNYYYNPVKMRKKCNNL